MQAAVVSGRRIYPRKILVILIFGVMAVLSVFICVGIGTVSFSLEEVFRALFIADDSTARLLIWNIRFPRILVGGLVGVCLSLAGGYAQYDGISLHHWRHQWRELCRISGSGCFSQLLLFASDRIDRRRICHDDADLCAGLSKRCESGQDDPVRYGGICLVWRL